MSDVIIINRILDSCDDHETRACISLLSKYWCELEQLTRRHVSVTFCYVITPQRLLNRYPNIESLKVKGKPRAALYGLLPENWGGSATSWVSAIVHFPKLSSLHFRRMVVSDSDLERIVSTIEDGEGREARHLLSLNLEGCSGFSTHGLLAVTRKCRNLHTLVLEESDIDVIDGDWLHQLALNNKVVHTLNLNSLSLDDIDVSDLEILAYNCPLKFIAIRETNIRQLHNFFHYASTLEEFYGGSYREVQINEPIRFPEKLSSMGPMYFYTFQVPLISPIAPLLKRLDLGHASLDCHGHCELLQRCHSLENLKV